MAIEQDHLASLRGAATGLGKGLKGAAGPSHAQVKLTQELKNKKINKNSKGMFNASCSPEKRATSPYKRNKKLDLDDP
jgi:hypothetical protein